MKISDFMSELNRTLEEKSVAIPKGADSLLTLLYDTYFETQGLSSKEIREGYRSLNDCIQRLSPVEIETVIDLVSMLCMEHERSGFVAGVKLGFRLMKELNE